MLIAVNQSSNGNQRSVSENQTKQKGQGKMNNSHDPYGKVEFHLLRAALILLLIAKLLKIIAEEINQLAQ